LKFKLKEKLQHIIQDLNIQLEDECVLTEAASGAYACTPVLAALAGAGDVCSESRNPIAPSDLRRL
jgi:hypothetical protein